MSDYLTRLSARALGVAHAVRPAIPPMFAAAPAVLMPPPANEDRRGELDAPSEPERDEERLPAAPVAPRRPSLPAALSVEPAARPFHADDAWPLPSRPHDPGARASSASDNSDVQPSSPPFRAGREAFSPARDSRLDRNEHAVETSRAIKPPALAAAPAPSAVANTAGSAAPASRSAERIAAPAPVPLPDDGESEMPAAPVNLPVGDVHISLQRDSGSDTSPVIEPPRHRALRVETPAARHDDAVPQRALYSDARSQFDRLRALGDGARPQPVATPQNSGPPIVRISIGRIEVRAVPARAPAAPPASRGPARPGITLAHYLARNRGGRT